MFVETVKRWCCMWGVEKRPWKGCRPWAHAVLAQPWQSFHGVRRQAGASSSSSSFSLFLKRKKVLICHICIRNANQYFHSCQFSLAASDTNHPQTLADLEYSADFKNHYYYYSYCDGSQGATHNMPHHVDALCCFKSIKQDKKQKVFFFPKCWRLLPAAWNHFKKVDRQQELKVLEFKSTKL